MRWPRWFKCWSTVFRSPPQQIEWLIEWCFTLLSTLLQLYHGDRSHIHVFPGVHQYKAGALKCLPQGHSYKKNPVDQVRLKHGASRLWVIHFTTGPPRTFPSPTENDSLKHCGKKEKMVVTSISSFTHNVFPIFYRHPFIWFTFNVSSARWFPYWQINNFDVW